MITNTDEARSWFLNHSSGLCELRREDGTTTAVDCYPDAVAFFADDTTPAAGAESTEDSP